ncbi:MAG: serine/threonine-protein phosphatase [Ruminococcus sp.]|nr:serine/threonine-protein phosphatase [Ruminococcus sp.]
MRYFVTEITDLGSKKKVNQDASRARVARPGLTEGAFGVVCDGVGSCEHSEVASRSAAEAFDNWFTAAYPDIDDITDEDEFCSLLYERWYALFDSVNDYVIDFAEINQIKLGSTFTCILLRNMNYYILHIGDTRVYRITDEMEQLTTDHTVVAREVSRGIITAEQAKKDSRRHTLTKCVGMKRHIRPEFYTGQIQGNTKFLICSDGFRDRADDESILDAFGGTKTLKKDRLSKAAKKVVRLVRDAGEKDNITAVIIEVSEE